MPTLYVVGAVTSVGLLFYLLYAMLRPEDFS
jgi:K+-transporting ATPase KdpF subunit